VNSGSNNAVIGNIIDLGSSAMVLAVAAGGSDPKWGMEGNNWSGNIIISNFAGRQRTSISGDTGYTWYQPFGPASNFAIKTNVYYNYGGGEVRTDGKLASDSNSIVGDPQIAGWTYMIASSSIAFRKPVNFAPIAGGWGPPGFVIPRDGTAPSSPH
jgi:hypothetical protein